MLRGLDGLNTLIYDLIKVEESPAFTNPIFEIRPFVIKNIKFSINSVNDSVEQTIYSRNLKSETESECDYVIIQEVDITDQIDDKNAPINATDLEKYHEKKQTSCNSLISQGNECNGYTQRMTW